MNRWQTIFLAIGATAVVLIIIFPPQILPGPAVQFLPVWYGNPIDWIRLFLWTVAIFLFTGLGITANKSDHYR